MVLSSILDRYQDYMVHLMKAFFCGYKKHHQFFLLFDNNGLLYVLFQIHMLKSTKDVLKKKNQIISTLQILLVSKNNNLK